MMILATDLDGTFLGGSQEDKLQLYRQIREGQDIQLIFVTGRGIESVWPLLNDSIIPNPDYIICDVGATVLNGRTLEAIQPLQPDIESRWPGTLAIRKAMEDIPGLRYQEVPQERRCSFYYDETVDWTVVEDAVNALGCDMLKSAGKYIDVLPKGVNKGATLKALVKLLNLQGEKVLVAGDTLNDASLYETGYMGVVVGEAEEKLVTLTKSNKKVFHANRAGAGGILEAIGHFPAFHRIVALEENIPEYTTGDTQLLMVYHRLPFETTEINGTIHRNPPKSPNGIIPSLLGFFYGGRTGAWIASEESERKQTQDNIVIDKKKYPNLVASPISMTKKEIELFYKVFSKEAFWPVIFSFTERAKFNHTHWEHYVNINRRFAEKVAQQADANAMVWIHEYNLWLVPGMLRQMRPDVKIGFFHHTSFPPADIFNIIPWRREIIGSMLQCDYIGFHIPRYVENFVDVVKSHVPAEITEQVNCAPRFLTYSCALGVDKMTKEINTGQRKVRLGAHPVGVNMNNIRAIFNQEKIQADIKQLQERMAGKKVILSLERLDYVKGPLEKIRAFADFLEQYPEFHGKVELINICTPPADGMKIYEKVQTELEQAIGKINGKYSRLDWVPIRFFFRPLPFEEVLTYYAIADIAWITPLRDGLNLVAKEYAAVQGLKEKPDGVLIVSEFAGVSVELPYAIRTNPYDRKDLRESLLQALTMEEQDRILSMKRSFDVVAHYDIEYWGKEFLEELAAEEKTSVQVVGEDGVLIDK